MLEAPNPASEEVLDTSRSTAVALSEKLEAERDELFERSQALRNKYLLHSGLGSTIRQGG